MGDHVVSGNSPITDRDAGCQMVTSADRRDGDAAMTIATDRLLLRPHRADDHGALSAMWADPAVVRHVGGQPASAEESWARILRYAGHWRLHGFGSFAVTDRTTGAFLGETGAADFRRGIAGFGDLPEMGWVFVARVHGTGIAGEAVRAALDWLDRGPGAVGTHCMINPAAAPSRRLAARVGYRESGTAIYHGRPVLLYRRDPGATFAPAPG